MIRVPKGCGAPALYHILMCKLICNNNIWYERSTKGAFDTLIVIWKILDMMECGKYNGTCLAQSTTP